MSKKILSIIILTCSLLIGLRVATAQDPILRLQKEEVKQSIKDTEFAACFQGWRQFVSSVIGYQGFIDYWKEIIEFNTCYRTDLDLLQQQVNKARRQVRSTFLRCDLKNLDQYTRAYYKLEAELYFLRHMFQKGEPLTSGSHEQQPLMDRISDPTAIRGLLNDMKNFFVIEKGFLTDQLLQEYVQEFVAKYRPRIASYNNCRDDYYEEFDARINDLVQSFKDFASVFKGESEREKKRRLEREKAQQAAGFKPQSENPRNGPIASIEEDFELNIWIAALKVSPEKSFDELKEDLSTMPGTSNKSFGLSFDKAPFAVSYEKQRFFEESSRAEMEARYKLLYGTMSDGGVHDVMDKMDELITTVQTTIPDMKLVEKCVDEVESRECTNKK